MNLSAAMNRVHASGELTQGRTQTCFVESPTARTLRVGGLVVPGSVRRGEDGLTIHFDLTDQAQSVSVTPAGTTKLDRRAVGVPYQDKSNAARWATGGDGKRCRGNTWFIPYETIQSRDRDRPHPACFPPKVPEQCLRLHGVDPVKTVLDPFLGLGNTPIAAGGLACSQFRVCCGSQPSIAATNSSKVR